MSKLFIAEIVKFWKKGITRIYNLFITIWEEEKRIEWITALLSPIYKNKTGIMLNTCEIYSL